jgi:hypothetical protein
MQEDLDATKTKLTTEQEGRIKAAEEAAIKAEEAAIQAKTEATRAKAEATQAKAEVLASNARCEALRVLHANLENWNKFVRERIAMQSALPRSCGRC